MHAAPHWALSFSQSFLEQDCWFTNTFGAVGVSFIIIIINTFVCSKPQLQFFNCKHHSACKYDITILSEVSTNLLCVRDTPMMPKPAVYIGGSQGFGTQLKCKIKGKETENEFTEKPQMREERKEQNWRNVTKRIWYLILRIRVRLGKMSQMSSTGVQRDALTQPDCEKSVFTSGG